jgi:hypothetical protein
MLQYERFYDDCALLAREVFKEEVTEEIKLSIFSADASCSQHTSFCKTFTALAQSVRPAPTSLISLVHSNTLTENLPAGVQELLPNLQFRHR